MKNDKSLFFLTIALVCIWLILDNFMGEKYVNQFLKKMFSFMDGEDDSSGLIDMDSEVKKLGETEKYVIQRGMTEEDSEKIKNGERAKDENGKDKIIFVF